MYLAPSVDWLPIGHPLKRFVCFLALDARVQTGALPSQRDHDLPNDGERYARGALMPTREFAAVGHLSDRALAARFGVPVEQVAQRRKDLDNV